MDDDPGIREFYRALLSSHGYVALIARSGHDALLLLTARANEIAIVVSDYVMPNMDGAVLAALIKRGYPCLPVLLFTASQISKI